MLSGQPIVDQSSLPERVAVLHFEVHFRQGMNYEAAYWNFLERDFSRL